MPLVDPYEPKRSERKEMAILIKKKPLSVNQCWQGKRYKTPIYKKYERDLLLMLPRIKLPEPPYQIYYEFGFSSGNADLDNPIKPFQDILQKKYNFNDKDIDVIIAVRMRVSKGNEYIKFKISEKK